MVPAAPQAPPGAAVAVDVDDEVVPVAVESVAEVDMLVAVDPETEDDVLAVAVSEEAIEVEVESDADDDVVDVAEDASVVEVVLWARIKP